MPFPIALFVIGGLLTAGFLLPGKDADDTVKPKAKKKVKRRERDSKGRDDRSGDSGSGEDRSGRDGSRLEQQQQQQQEDEDGLEVGDVLGSGGVRRRGAGEEVPAIRRDDLSHGEPAQQPQEGEPPT